MIRDSSSFRDPSGFIFEIGDGVFRFVAKEYQSHYMFLEKSGLLEGLIEKKKLINHEIVSLLEVQNPDHFLTLKPDKLPLVSYPYEWSFNQLKDAALLTLDIAKEALSKGMILKDASAFNIQFIGYKPIFIDTLSFSIYEQGSPWAAYKQFCEHFIAPLCIGAYLGSACLSLQKPSVDGVNLKLASKILPASSWFNFSVLINIHLHSKAQDFYKEGSDSKRKITKHNLFGFFDHLFRFVQGLKLPKNEKTQWYDYDLQTHYSMDDQNHKAKIVQEFINLSNPSIVWDIGSNDGLYSRLIAKEKRIVLSLDSDPIAIDKNYLFLKKNKISNVFPLIFDINNPSPSLGWANQERKQLNQRSKPDLILALALIHHLVIVNNVPFIKVAQLFAETAPWLIIEYIDIEDQKVAALPATAGKKNYSRKFFDEAFFTYFDLISEIKIGFIKRSILILKVKS